MTKLDKIGFEIEGEWGSKFCEKVKTRLPSVFHGDASITSCRTVKCGSLDRLELNSVPVKVHYVKKGALKDFFDFLQFGWEKDEFHANRSSGFHVHVSFKEFPSEIMSSRFYSYFITRYRDKFPKEYEARKDNSFCSVPTSVEKFALDLVKKEVRYKKEFEKADKFAWREIDRYKAINMRASWDERETVEFRIFPACEPKRMYDMLLFLINIIDEFLENDEFSFIFAKNIKSNKRKATSFKIVGDAKDDGVIRIGDRVRFRDVWERVGRIPPSGDYVYPFMDEDCLHGMLEIGDMDGYWENGAKVVGKGKKERYYLLEWETRSAHNGEKMRLSFKKDVIVKMKGSEQKDKEINLICNLKGIREIVEKNGYTVVRKERKGLVLEGCAVRWL